MKVLRAGLVGLCLPVALGVGAACSSSSSSGTTPAHDAGFDVTSSSDATPDTHSSDVVVTEEAGTDAVAQDAPTEASDGGDAGEANDASDASDASEGGAPVVTETVNPTGIVSIFPDAVFGSFFEDDVIVTTSDAPQCVLHIRSATKPNSAAGNLTVGGDFVGEDGGYPAPQVIAPSAGPVPALNAYGAFADSPPWFIPPFPSTDHVQLSADGTPTVPAIPVQTLEAPAFALVQINSPVVPDSGANVIVDHTKPFAIQWTVPSGAGTQRVSVSLHDLSDYSHIGSIFCGYALSAGEGVIPSSILNELWTRLAADDAGTLNDGFLRILVGDQESLTPSGASYIIEVGNETGASFTLDYGFTLQ